MCGSLERMTISVAMATFNGGRYLREQLDSIRRQSLLPMELVVCDDGSSDDTMDILRRFASDAPFKVVIDAHGRRLGFTPNFLRAIARCTGDIVALSPPLIVERHQVARIVEPLSDAIRAAAA